MQAHVLAWRTAAAHHESCGVVMHVVGWGNVAGPREPIPVARAHQQSLVVDRSMSGFSG